MFSSNIMLLFDQYAYPASRNGENCGKKCFQNNSSIRRSITKRVYSDHFFSPNHLHKTELSRDTGLETMYIIIITWIS